MCILHRGTYWSDECACVGRGGKWNFRKFGFIKWDKCCGVKRNLSTIFGIQKNGTNFVLESTFRKLNLITCVCVMYQFTPVYPVFYLWATVINKVHYIQTCLFIYLNFGYFGAMESDNPYRGKHGMHYNRIRSFYSFQIYVCGSDMYVHVMMLVYNFHDSQGVLSLYLVLQIAVDMLDLLSYQCNRKLVAFLGGAWSLTV